MLPAPNYEDSLTLRHYRLGQFAIVGLTLCVSACDGGEKKQLESKLRSAQLELQDVRTHTADRDQLYSEVIDAARFVSDIQLELSKVRSRSKPKNLSSSERERPNRSRAELLGDVKQVLSHLDSVEQQLTRFEGKARATDSIRAQLGSLQKTIASLRAAALDQQTQIESLSRELASVRVERDSLADKVVGMQDVENTVFVIAKPLTELVQLGAVVEEGGRKGFLGLGGKKGTTLVPGRNLREADFTSIDKTADEVLPLPRADRRYKIVSRHDGKLLSPPAAPDGTISSPVKVVDPEHFWSTSRFLILVERAVK
jgi:hypothetical protein